MTPAQPSTFPIGKVMISATTVATMIGPFVFDFNETHIFNEAWPPHAKFHNAQTMTSGALLSATALYHLWRPRSSRESLVAATIAASTYWVSQLSARLYPGTASVDPPGEDSWPQLKYALPILATITTGHLLELARIRRRRRTG